MNNDTRRQYQMCYQGGHIATIEAVRRRLDEKLAERFQIMKAGGDPAEIDTELDNLEKALDSVIGNNRHFGL